MATIGIRELRSALSGYVKRAQVGERLVITVDGVPVAQLGALTGDFTGVSMADLIARGAVLAPRRRGDLVLDDPLLLSAGTRVDRALAQVRL
ncbi:MAG: hypothetical protein RIR69_1181 [Actinomycetota bacterium]|jgi:antitoxin (DNA-binding transcriptional repressor) of toxin-antitoxin stability system